MLTAPEPLAPHHLVDQFSSGEPALDDWLRKRAHGKGLGRALVQDAGRRVVNAADAIGIRGIIVHALSDGAAAFYRKLGFDPSPLDPTTLMVTVADLRAALK